MFNPENDDDPNSLIEKIHNEIRKIRHHETELGNNIRTLEYQNPFDKALIDNNSFSLVIHDSKVAGSITRIDPVQKLKEDLENELQMIHNETSKLVKRISDLQEFNASLDKNEENLKLMFESCKNLEVPNLKMDVIEKNIKQRFLKEKRELKIILTTLFPDNLDAQDLIAQILEHYFKEGADKYMQLENTDNTPEQIEFLMSTELFELNPHNSTQIRLIDLS